METESRKRARVPSCPVCYEIPFDPKVSMCGHGMCGPCVLRLEDKRCPVCRQRTRFHANQPLLEVLETNFPEEYEMAKSKHVPKFWIAERTKEDPTIALLDSTFPPPITIRLLRRMERLLWCKPEVTMDDIEEYCCIAEQLFITVTSKDSLARLPQGEVLRVLRRDRIYTVYMWLDLTFNDDWLEDLN